MKLTGLSRLLAEQPSYRHILEACDVPAAERPVQTLIGAVAGVQAPLIADLAVAVRRQSRTGKTPLTLIITPTERYSACPALIFARSPYRELSRVGNSAA